jgi:hypothetical protein
MSAPFDTITILTTKGPLATKRITAVSHGPPKIAGYGQAKLFSFAEIPVSSFDEMAAAIEGLQHKPCSFLVRGKPADGIDREYARRRLHARKKPNGAVEPATLLAQPRFWLALDFDSIQCPDHIDLIWDVDAVIEHVTELLPEEFHGVSTFWAFTSGHGIKPGIRLRLFYWLDRALSDEEVELWLAKPIAEKLIDPVLYRPAQPIYVAQPIFVKMPDPVPRRCGIWRGHSDEVEVPVIEQPKAKARAHSSDAPYTGTGGGGYEFHRGRIGDHEGGGGFHLPVKSAVASWIGRHGSAADPAWLRADLERAISEAPRDRARRGDDYIEFRIGDLDPLITALRELQAAKEAEQATIEPSYPAPLGSAKHVRKDTLEPVMNDFSTEGGEHLSRPPGPESLTDLNAHPSPPVHAIAATPGLSKTTLFLKHVVPPTIKNGMPVNIAMPRHKLGDQMVDDLVPYGVTGGGYRGREADDPDMPGREMCLDLSRVKAIERAWHNASKFACEFKTHKCDHYYFCGYQKQKRENPDVWMIPHQLLFQSKPEFIKKGILGIDEAFWNCSIKNLILSLSVLPKTKFVPIKRKRKLYALGNQVAFGKTADLVKISCSVYAVLASQPTGWISRQALIDARITLDDVRHAYKMEWERKLDLEEVWPGLPAKDVIAACEIIAEHNQEVKRLVTFWELLARTLEGDFKKSPWLDLREDKNGEREVKMTWRADIHESWIEPTMIMDACLPTEIVKQFFPNMQEPVVATAAMPHARVRQITDRAMAHSMFIPRDWAREQEIKTCANNVKSSTGLLKSARHNCTLVGYWLLFKRMSRLPCWS